MRFLGSLSRGSFLWSLLRAARVMPGKRWRSISRAIDLAYVVPEALFRKLEIRWSTRLLWTPRVKSHQVSLGDTMFLSQISFLMLIASLYDKVCSLVQSFPILRFPILRFPILHLPSSLSTVYDVPSLRKWRRVDQLSRANQLPPMMSMSSSMACARIEID